MLIALRHKEDRLDPLIADDDPAWLQKAAWIDLVNPSDEERAQVETLLNQPLPHVHEVEELEASSLSAVLDDELQLNCLFLHRVEGLPHNTNVAFLLSQERLVTLSAREIPILRLFRMRAQHASGMARDPLSVLLTLLEIKVDNLADILEEGYQGLEVISRQVLDKDKSGLQSAIDGLAKQEDFNGKVRLCLMDSQRDLSFLLRRAKLTPESAEQVRLMLGDIGTLLPHHTFTNREGGFPPECCAWLHQYRTEPDYQDLFHRSRGFYAANVHRQYLRHEF